MEAGVRVLKGNAEFIYLPVWIRVNRFVTLSTASICKRSLSFQIRPIGSFKFTPESMNLTARLFQQSSSRAGVLCNVEKVALLHRWHRQSSPLENGSNPCICNCQGETVGHTTLRVSFVTWQCVYTQAAGRAAIFRHHTTVYARSIKRLPSPSNRDRILLTQLNALRSRYEMQLRGLWHNLSGFLWMIIIKC